MLGGATIQFKRPLRPFQRFELVTRILGWDAKWFYVEQVFTSEGKIVASALVRGIFRAPGKSIPSGDVLEAIGHKEPSPPLGTQILTWARLQDETPTAPQPV